MPTPSDLVVPCPACRSLNRLPQARLGDVPICASCRHHLLGETIALDDDSFDGIAAKVTPPLVVDFWAAWCGPCRFMAPHFERAARELPGAFVFAKVDTEAAPRTAERFAIRSIPTLVLLRGGNELRRISGALQHAQLLQWLRS